MVFTIAIIGRPNVGKSTLFNRLVGQKLALVGNVAGMTRDRRIHRARLQDLEFDIMDTAGLEEAQKSSLTARMVEQTMIAVKDADLILFLIDARTGLVQADEIFSSLLRKFGKKVILVANKSESRQAHATAAEAWQLGFGEPCTISAEHGLGLSDLRDAIVAKIGENEFSATEKETIADTPSQKQENSFADSENEDEDEDENEDESEDDEGDSSVLASSRALKIAIVGRPNTGKSTLINRIIGQERFLTGGEAGITRDAISIDYEWNGRTMKFYDTAGLRRKAHITEEVEKLSVADTLRAIRFAEVVVLVLDATIPFEKQDLQIANLVFKEGRAAVIVFNKWDKIDNKSETRTLLQEQCTRLLPQMRGIYTIAVSGEKGWNIQSLLETIVQVYAIWNRRISTGKLNRWLEKMVLHSPPPAVAGRRLKVKYMTQIKTRPPTFILSCSHSDAMPQSYLRYLVNGLREDFDLPGVPIRLFARTADNPFAPKS